MRTIMMRVIKKYFIKTVSILLALLFIYAAASKMLGFENFQVQLAQSPLLSAYAGTISYSIIIIEIIVAISLFIPYANKLALYASLGLMSAFTIYIYLILNFSDFIPCSCGGILEKLGWKEHLVFNIFFFLLAAIAIFVIERKNGKGLGRSIQLSVLTTVISCAIVVVLFLRSEYIIKKENNFTRRFLLHPVVEVDKLTLSDKGRYYFAGGDNDNIYLGSTTSPLELSTIDTALRSVKTMHIKTDNFTHNFKNLQVQTRGRFFYLFDGTVPVIYRGRLGSPDASTVSINEVYFNQLVVLDSLKFGLRTRKSQDKAFSLGLLNSGKFVLNPNILEKQIDGIFDSDGSFLQNNNSTGLTYIYTYRNEFITMDSALNVVNRFNTIDTTKIAQIKIASLSNGNFKMSAPPLKVNRNAAINGNLIFIQSDLMGENESRQNWRKSRVVDIYLTDRKQYLGSFYILNEDEESLTGMYATDNYLYVILGGNFLKRYVFSASIKKEFKTGEAENQH